MTTAPSPIGRLLSGWWLLAALFLVLSGTVASNQGLDSRRLVVAAVLAGLATVATVMAPRHPVAAGLAVGALVGGYFALGFGDGPIFLVLPAVTFLLTLHLSGRRWAATAVAAMGVASAGLLARGVWWGYGVRHSLEQSAGLVVVACAAGAVAMTVRSRRQASAERAQHAATEEQLRMARDLHDGVGHGLAVIAMQSGVALHLLDKEVVDRVAARRALQAIRETSRESLEALRTELSRLTPTASAPITPRRGLADLDVLVERIRAGGLSVELRGGSNGTVSQLVDETAYAIVQEALTNVLRHASAERAVIELRREDDRFLVTVTDDGQGSAVVEGLGITGMRSRVRRLGGTLHVGRTGRGFEVRAELPLGSSA